MAKVVKLKVNQWTQEDRERSKIAKEFEEEGLDKNSSIMAAFLIRKIQKLTKRVEQLERRSKHHELD